MSLYQLIRGLAKDRKVSISRIEKDVHIANGTLRKWDTSMPKAKNVQKVDATNIGFRAVKLDKTIIDVKRAGVSKVADGYWVFKIPKEFTQLASPAQKAHIYVQDKDNIYTSSDITFYIEPQFGENSGVSAESIEEIKRLLETAHALNIDLQRIQK